MAGNNANVASVKMLGTSAYDSITEIISHGIKHFHKLEEFFKNQKDSIAKKGYHSNSFCYPTTLLKYAKTGACAEAYKLRTDILNGIARKELGLDGGDSGNIRYVYNLFEHLNLEYPFVVQEHYCLMCNCRCLVNIHSLNLYELSRDHTVWENYTALQARLDIFFGHKTKQCDACKQDCTYYHVDPSPLLCINIEILYNFVYVEGDSNLAKIYHSEMVQTSLKKLPSRLTIRGSVYVLYGVIGRSQGELHYVSYHRNPGNKWIRKDGFEGDQTELNNLWVDSIAMLFYAEIGYWDLSKRKLLLEPAKAAWNELTNVDLPNLCLEGILGFLDNRQLKMLIDGVKEERLKCDFTRLTVEAEEDNLPIYCLSSRSSEYQEQSKRLHNVVVYNLPLSDGVSDIDRVKQLFKGISGIDLENITVRRCHTQPRVGGSPILKVTFKNHFETKYAVKPKGYYNSNIQVCHDYTKWQRDRYKELMDVAEKHNQANPNTQKTVEYEVQYIDGVPTLVKVKCDSRRWYRVKDGKYYEINIPRRLCLK